MMERTEAVSRTQVSQFSALVQYSRPMLTAAGVFTILIMIVGVMGNLLTVMALLRHKKLRTVAAAFIASLCVSDLLFCFLVLPFSASQFFHGKWIHGDVLCQMIPTLRYGSVGVSLLSIASISVNRCILIARPQLYGAVYTKTKVTLHIAAVWLFSYGLQVPTLLNLWGSYGMDDRLGTCSINADERGHNPKMVLFVLGFALPCLVIIVSYLSIYRVVRKSHEQLRKHEMKSAVAQQQQSQPSPVSRSFKRSELRIAKMTLAIFCSFVVCYLPLVFVKVADSKVDHPLLHVMGYLLIYLSSCVNPLVYVTMNRQYRMAYLDTLRCRRDSQRLDSQQTQQHATQKVV